MQLRFSLFLVSTIITVARAAIVADVLAGFQKFDAQMKQLGNVIDKLPNVGGASSEALLQIHNDITSAEYIANATTSDAKTLNAPISESGGQIILDGVGDSAPLLLHFLQAIMAKKLAFESGVSEFPKQDLIDLKNILDVLGGVLISKLLPDFGAQFTQAKSLFDKTFNETISSF